MQWYGEAIYEAIIARDDGIPSANQPALELTA